LGALGIPPRKVGQVYLMESAQSTGGSGFINDDASTGLFRVRRRVFTDPAILVREQERIFEKCWLYVGHESEIPKPGDFRSRRVAGRPLIMVRGNDARLRVLLNTCRHRGAMVCRERAGNTKTFQCFYHAWTYDNEGSLVGVPGEEAYGGSFSRIELGLMPPAQTSTYRGFVFVNFDQHAEDLETYLAGSKEYLDLFCDQGEPGGLEILEGSHEYCMHANWKLLVENSIDGYHVSSAHHRYFIQYLKDMGVDSKRPLNGILRGGVGRSLGNGHAVMEGPGVRAMDEFQRKQWEERFGVERTVRMMDHSHNLLIFPNLIFVNSFRTVRTFFPVAPNEVEINAWALMPKDDTREVRQARLANFLGFLGPGGFATPDDAEGLECCQRGFANTEVGWSDISRGMMREQPLMTDELQMRTFWRRWDQLLASK
jgi:p-cumate 2,3-dioxygenase subunit alpha